MNRDTKIVVAVIAMALTVGIAGLFSAFVIK